MNNAQTLLSMPGVGFFGMLIIGILAGYFAEKVTSSDRQSRRGLDRRNHRIVDLAALQRPLSGKLSLASWSL